MILLAYLFGNYTSQFFANIYLNELDQFVKHTLKIRYYTRYMDDFIILAKTKKDCIYIKKCVEDFLHNKLHLDLNDKSRYYPYAMGVNFCGYRIFTTHRLLRLDSKKKIKKKIKHWNMLYKKNELNFDYTMQSINSWLGHASHCNSYLLSQKMLNKCDFLYNDKSNEVIEENLLSLIDGRIHLDNNIFSDDISSIDTNNTGLNS